MDYAGRHKYDLPGRAERYRDRSSRRNAEEWALLEGVLDRLPAPTHVLDVPCGTGRIAEALRLRGLDTACGDLSPAMREATDSRMAALRAAGDQAPLGRHLGTHAIDLEAPPGALEPADLVVCFRFFHHLPDEAARLRALEGLRKLTGGHLVLSFFHPVSAHNLSRQVKARLRGRPSDRHTIGRRALTALARKAGFEAQGFQGLAPWRRDLWLGWFT